MFGFQYVTDETIEPGTSEFFAHIIPWMNSYKLPWIMGRIEREAALNHGKHLREIDCATVYQWRKYFDFVSGHYYPGAYRDFQAGIYSTTFTFPREVNITQLSIRHLVDKGEIYVWGRATPSP